jgi:lactoylglutathione lyase
MTEQSSTRGLEAGSLSVSLTATDLEKSLHWYTEVLGFEIDRQHEREGRLVAVSLRAGAARILLNRDNGALGWDRRKGAGCSFFLTTEQDVDALASGIKARGGTLAAEPADMPWGPRVFRVVDPDGFAFAIAREPSAS